jgi:hypothetical protein
VLTPRLPVVLPNETSRARFGDDAGAVVDSVGSQVAGHNPLDTCEHRIDGVCAVALQLITAASTDPEGDPVPKDVAVRRLIGLLNATRTTITPSGDTVPQGVELAFNVQLLGLEGRRVFITWSVFERNSRDRLFGNWLRTNTSYRLKARDDDDPVDLNIWVPLPKERGRYFVRIWAYVDDDREPIQHRDSPRFG